ncbi:MAG: exodeoxyribonuclease VII large subunit [Gammaproteobacteria bacterium]
MMDMEQEDHIYSVSQLNQEVKCLLEDTYMQIWVEGEVSNFVAPGSGHWYFSLKDSMAQVRCAMFKGNQRRLTFTPKDGSHILIRARVSLYPNRGDYQLIAEHMEERGEGKLRREFELLKKKLEAAGLFAEEHKKALPNFPTTIGVVTSSTGAAIRDILNVLKRRYACTPVIIYPTLVQGATAAPAIVKAIQTANERKECDVLIIARGGGSLEDLWPFNEEIVAHAIYNSQIPTITGIGHEIDFTIADFVADLRAPTPSAAAEIISPDSGGLKQTLLQHYQQINRIMIRKLNSQTQQLAWMQKHLLQQHPKRQLAEKMQRLDFCEMALVQSQVRMISQLQAKVKELDHKLYRLNPINQIQHNKNQLQHLYQRGLTALQQQTDKKQSQLASLAATLDALSPLATLKRGFSIASINNQIIRQAKDVTIGDKINIRLEDGQLNCSIENVLRNNNEKQVL